jgi:hypothetical protein
MIKQTPKNKNKKTPTAIKHTPTITTPNRTMVPATIHREDN